MTTGADQRLHVPRQARSRTVKGSRVTANTRDAPAPADLGQLLLDAKFSVPQPRQGTVGHSDLVETARSSGCRLIAVTAYDSDADRQRSQEVGFERHLVKPVDPCELLEQVAAQ